MKTLTLTVLDAQRPHFAADDSFLSGIEWGRHDRRPMHPDDWEYFSWLRTQHGFARVDRPRLTTDQEDNVKLAGTTKRVMGLTLQSHVVTLSDGTIIRTCPNSGHCVNPCVGNNGNGAYPTVQRARDARTEYFANQPGMAFFHVGFEVGRTLRKHGAVEFRPKINDDMDWGLVCPSVATIEGMTAYGYTKLDYPTVILNDNSGFVEAYSLNEKSTLDHVHNLVNSGISIAAATNRKKHAPVRQWGQELLGLDIEVVDADFEDDWMVTAARQGRPVIGDLSAKGKAKTLARTERRRPGTATGRFVQHAYQP